MEAGTVGLSQTVESADEVWDVDCTVVGGKDANVI